jgi:hypothetical protein
VAALIAARSEVGEFSTAAAEVVAAGALEDDGLDDGISETCLVVVVEFLEIAALL